VSWSVGHPGPTGGQEELRLPSGSSELSSPWVAQEEQLLVVVQVVIGATVAVCRRSCWTCCSRWRCCWTRTVLLNIRGGAAAAAAAAIIRVPGIFKRWRQVISSYNKAQPRV
jgi:hypothetical protein